MTTMTVATGTITNKLSPRLTSENDDEYEKDDGDDDDDVASSRPDIRTWYFSGMCFHVHLQMSTMCVSILLPPIFFLTCFDRCSTF